MASGQARMCRYCGNSFSAVSKIHAFCSDACRKAVRGNDYRKARTRALFRDGFTCTEPGCDATTTLECHHKIPLFMGGDHSLDNLQTLCHNHHRAKHRRYKEVIIENEIPTEQRRQGRRQRADKCEVYDRAA